MRQAWRWRRTGERADREGAARCRSPASHHGDAALSTQQGWASIGGVGFAEAGGTLGYGRSDADLYRRGAHFVQAILQGRKAGHLPIEQASRFELVLNMNSVRALSLKVPASIAARADRTVG